jgi:subtilisin family serine protease
VAKKRFIVMPGQGIAGPAMQASVFQADGGGDGLMDAFGRQPGRFSAGHALAAALVDELTPFSSMAGGAMGLAEAAVAAGGARPAGAALAETIDEQDFEVLSQRFDDGPAVVAMTEAARLALEASHPDLRVLPITRYYLPGYSPFRRAKAVAAAGQPAAQSAVLSGSVFTEDAKQHFLAGTDAGSEGQGVLVGVLDTGIDKTHPALQRNVSVLRCLIPGANAAAGGPVNWGAARAAQAAHGTHVAGIIAAEGGQGGPAGVAPRARLASYRIFPDNPSGLKGAENPVIIDSIRAAIDDGCHIINLSIEGATLKEDGVRSAIADAWNQGVLCVAAAGNGFGKPVSYPAALPHCVAVTAIGRNGAFPADPAFTQYVSAERATSDPEIFLARFSNFGPPVQFTAPGHAIVSTFPQGEWWFDSGTSMAAPFISGLLARLLSNNGNILNMIGNAQRSAAMLQMLVGRARLLGLPQGAMEGYGLPS